MSGRIIKGMFLALFVYITVLSFRNDQFIISNLNLQKNIDAEYEVIEYKTKYIANRNLDALEERIYASGLDGYGVSYANSDEQIVIREPSDEIIEIGPIESFTGWITGYGPDCVGCSGVVACAPYPDVRNGNIYFEDKKYGTLRIVAADKGIPCGTIVQITNYKFSEEPIFAIVLDRGGAIKGKHMDLLHNGEKETKIIGLQTGVQFDIVRKGW